MRVRSVLFVVVAVLAVQGSAAAKFMAVRVVVNGPGMDGPQVLRKDILVTRVTSRLVFATERAKRPVDASDGYTLEYRFAVADENGTHIDLIHQTIYPFADGRPLVYTPPDQAVHTTYGDERIRGGWFEAPAGIVATLQKFGLPEEPVPAAPASDMERPSEAPTGSFPWMVVLLAAAAVLIVLAFGGARRPT